jgi:hypothetical protein
LWIDLSGGFGPVIAVQELRETIENAGSARLLQQDAPGWPTEV